MMTNYCFTLLNSECGLVASGFAPVDATCDFTGVFS